MFYLISKDNKIVDKAETKFEVHKDLVWIEDSNPDYEPGFDTYDKKTKVFTKYVQPEFTYDMKRRMEYGSLESQLDMIYHDGIDAWKEKIRLIKEKHPKA